MEYFKYLNQERIDVLTNLQIRYSQALVFNDPFEAFPAIIDENKDWYFKNFIKEMEIATKLMPFTNLEEKQRFIELSRKHFPDFYSHISDGNRQVIQAHSIVMSDAVTQGYLSLSKTSQSILMWSHYAQNHEGFILGFDANHEYFKSGTSAIKYQEQRPHLDPFHKQQDKSLFFTKSIDWAYEQEVRKSMSFTESEEMTFPDQLPESTDDIYDQIRLFKFPKSAITSVIFGWRSPRQFIEKVKEELDNHELSSVKLLAARPHPKEYKMIIHRL